MLLFSQLFMNPLSIIPTTLGDSSFVNSLLTSAGVAISLLPDLLQNGGSSLGTLPTPVLPRFLGGSGSSQQAPWGSFTAGNTNYYQNTPNTGVTRYYNLTLTRATLAPDGVQKQLIVVNGQFPGPLLEANWGDYFEITVHNAITGPEEGTTLHWHGMRMKKAIFWDGVPGVSQCPIPPGKSLTYRFQADLYGSSWYHSHYSAQYTDGAYGPMVIHGPSSTPYDIDLGPLLVSDYYHKTYRDLIVDVTSTDVVRSQTTFADNTLIQGKMNFDCSAVPASTKCTPNAGIAKLQFTSGKVHRLRIINPSSFAFMVVSIDHHTMTVIANDYVPLQPYDTKVLTLAAGQRVDVLVKGAPSPPSINGAYYLRARQPQLCSLATQPFGLAAIYYDNANTNAQPLSLPQLDFVKPRLLDCSNDALATTVPAYPIAIQNPDTTVRIEVTLARNATGHYVYKMNGSSFRADFNNPLLLAAQQGNLSFTNVPQANAYNFGRNETIRIVLKNRVPFSHPMHIHGQNMFVLNEGVGDWDGSTLIRPQNPQRRDTQILQPNGYLVLQLVSDNPGVWPFHCHFAWHVSQGLYINVVQKPDEIKKITGISSALGPNCQAWNQYTTRNTVDQLDSGVKLMS